MDDLLLAEPARRQLNALLAHMPHAVLLVGPAGVGKRTVAHALAAQLTIVGGGATVEPDDKGTIGIEAIRALYKSTRNRHEHTQVVIIDHAEAMGIEAQNAFLKLLEEPPRNVSFILTAPTERALLPTIGSRVQTVAITRLAPQRLMQVARTAAAQLTQQELAQLIFVADGRPGALMHLIKNPAAFAAYKQRMEQAKQLLAAKPYERLALMPALTKNKEETVALLEAMAHILYVQLQRAPAAQSIRLADALLTTLSRLAQNGNPRAQLTALFMRY